MPRITEARKTERRDQILHAAFVCFARAGFHKTTMQDICAEAELSPGAVYGYFPGKDAIIEALARGERKTNGGSPKPGSGLDWLFEGLKHPGDPRASQLDVRLWGEAIGDARLGALQRRADGALARALAAAGEDAARAHGLEPAALAELLAAVIAGLEVRLALDPEADPAAIAEALRTLLA
jgi:AcrR family transcriptional regulator